MWTLRRGRKTLIPSRLRRVSLLCVLCGSAVNICLSAKKESARGVPILSGVHAGRQLGVPLAYFPRLLNATKAQREGFIISGGGSGIHWDDLDEDISVRALLFGVGDRTRPARQAS